VTARTQLAIVAGLLVLLGTVDFIRRVYVGRDPGLRVFQSPVVQPLPQAMTSAAVLAQMQRWLPALGGSASEAGEGGQPAAVVLQGVFVGRGVSTAVLAFTPPAGGPAQTERAVVGDVVRGWTVTAIDRHSVTVEGDGGARQLVLFARQPTEAGGPPPTGAVPGAPPAGPPMGAAGPPMGAAGPPMGAAGPPMGAAGPPRERVGPPMGAAGPPMDTAAPPLSEELIPETLRQTPRTE
jgi:hypothetical protein